MVTTNTFWSVFRRSLVPMFVLDDDAQYVEVNRAACADVGLSREDFVGRRIGFGTAPRRQEQVAEMWEEFRRTGHLVMPFDFDAPGRTVRRFNVLCTADTPERGLHLSMYWLHPPDAAPLSPRELEVTGRLAEGLSGAEIARELDVSSETVRTHIRNAMRKLEVRTRAQLVAQALHRGLISL